jgi:hypothetical protein
MSTTQSFTTAAKQTEIVDSIATLYTKGVERLAETQKKILDLAQQHNAEAIDALKKIGQGTPGAPGLFILDLAATTFGQYADLQKSAIDLAVEQSQTLAGIAKERVNSVSKATDGVTALTQETVERTAALQKRAIEFSAAQTKTAIDAFKQQSGVAGTPVEAAATSFQHGVETIAETQKELLNIVGKASQTKARA